MLHVYFDMRSTTRIIYLLLLCNVSACSLQQQGRKPEPSSVFVTPATVLAPAEPAPVAIASVQAVTVEPLVKLRPSSSSTTRAVPPPIKPVAKIQGATAEKEAGTEGLRNTVICKSKRSGKGAMEKTTISCTNLTRFRQMVFLQINGIGVSGIPTIAAERAGYELEPGETRGVVTLTVISQPASIEFSHTYRLTP